MAGIYIHIPYCKQACHYCDFHFSTNLNTKAELIDGILKEIELQKKYLDEDTIETIYFGGGTPSLLSENELLLIIDRIHQNFSIVQNAEITLEANPDDLNSTKIKELKSAGINRLSIGIQSFNDDNLSYFNRAHNSEMAKSCVLEAQNQGIENISIDLIFGAPNQSIENLKSDLDQALALHTPHISIYGLTIEDNTVFGKWQKQEKLSPIDEDLAAQHLELIMASLSDAGFIQYEISNFCLPEYESRHNSSYWHGKKYLGLGPAAHSFNGSSRQSNVSNNIKYYKRLKLNEIPAVIEQLTNEDKINEFILTQLRLKGGVNNKELLQNHSFDLLNVKSEEVDQFKQLKMLELDGNYLRLTSKGKLLADFITEKLII